MLSVTKELGSEGDSGPARHALRPATSQVVDLVIALLLFFPECQVLLEELNDALGVTEVVFLELIDLVEGHLEGAVCQLACLGVILEDLVVKDREVEGESELDWVAGGKVDAIGFLVSGFGHLLDLLELVVLGVLSDVAIVVTDHLHEESLGLIGAFGVEDAVVDHVDDLLAVILELLLDLCLVGKECGIEFRVLRVLLNGRDGAASGALAADEVLEGDGEKVTLIGVDSAALDDKDLLEEVDHVFEALGLLGNSGEENLFFNVCSHYVSWLVNFLEFKL